MKLSSSVLVVLTAVIPAHGQTPSSTSSPEPTTTVSDFTATLTSSAIESSVTSQEGCPTVTLTSNVCRSCATPDCVELVPLTNSCDCPSAIPTAFVDYPCESGCGGIGCAANYVFFSANCTSETSSSTSGPASANSTASATGTGLGGLNSTASGITSAGTSTRSESATGTGTAAETSSSNAAAGRMRPFWVGLL